MIGIFTEMHAIKVNLLSKHLSDAIIKCLKYTFIDCLLLQMSFILRLGKIAARYQAENPLCFFDLVR